VILLSVGLKVSFPDFVHPNQQQNDHDQDKTKLNDPGLPKWAMTGMRKTIITGSHLYGCEINNLLPNLSRVRIRSGDSRRLTAKLLVVSRPIDAL
jgi:hypothetical protein